MRTKRIKAWAIAGTLAAVAAPAETFHTRDGVVFEGTIRQAVSKAAVCNVLEENHTEAEYERIKANQGQPLHLWRVDFTVRNASGSSSRTSSGPDLWTVSRSPISKRCQTRRRPWWSSSFLTSECTGCGTS